MLRLGRAQQVVAPLERGAQRPLARWGVPRPGTKGVQRLPQPGVQLLGAEDCHACCSELDRERQSVDAAAHTGDCPGVGRGQLEGRIVVVRTLHEEGAGRSLCDRFRSIVLRDLQRIHRIATAPPEA